MYFSYENNIALEYGKILITCGTFPLQYPANPSLFPISANAANNPLSAAATLAALALDAPAVCMMIFNRSNGAVHDFASAPARPPARNIATPGFTKCVTHAIAFSRSTINRYAVMRFSRPFAFALAANSPNGDARHRPRRARRVARVIDVAFFSSCVSSTMVVVETVARVVDIIIILGIGPPARARSVNPRGRRLPRSTRARSSPSLDGDDIDDPVRGVDESTDRSRRRSSTSARAAERHHRQGCRLSRSHLSIRSHSDVLFVRFRMIHVSELFHRVYDISHLRTCSHRLTPRFPRLFL